MRGLGEHLREGKGADDSVLCMRRLDRLWMYSRRVVTFPERLNLKPLCLPDACRHVRGRDGGEYGSYHISCTWKTESSQNFMLQLTEVKSMTPALLQTG